MKLVSYRSRYVCMNYSNSLFVVAYLHIDIAIAFINKKMKPTVENCLLGDSDPRAKHSVVATKGKYIRMSPQILSNIYMIFS